MTKAERMQNAFALVLLFALLEKSLAETSNENQLPLRTYSEKLPTQGPYVTGKSGFGRAKATGAGRDFYRRNYESKSDLVKKFPRREEGREDEYLRKTNKDALFGRSPERKLREEENFDSYNMKSLFNLEEAEEKIMAGNTFRSDDSYAPNRYPVLEGSDDYLSASRQKKLKKHGSGSSSTTTATITTTTTTSTNNNNNNNNNYNNNNNNGFIPFPPPRERKPNIILILTDDQDVELGSLNFMPKTLRLLRDGGAEFRHAYVTTPMCCPSRSSLLTGMYVHNHNVFTNNENCSSIQWQQTHETRTFATYLSNAGYRTGYFGKYLNKYNGSYVPPGWREWGGLIMNSRYYNYSINLNGKKIKHGFDYHKDYYPDLIANDSISFLRQSKQYFSRKPVMLVVSFPAPHGPEDSAPQYSKMFFNITTHHTPAYDFAPNPDKQWILQVTNKMQDIHKQFTNVLMTKRLQTLQSVDSAVERIYQELKKIGELDNTYIIYTSDHGYHLGQFGLVKGKSFPFEFDVRVPFLVRGPGIEAGTVIDDIVLNIDLAPSFLDIGGVEPPAHMDGRSIVRLLHHRSNKRRKLRWPDTFLIESSGRREIPDANPEAKRMRHEKLRIKEARMLKGKGSVSEDADGVTHTADHPRSKEMDGRVSPDSSEAEVDEIEEEENSEEDTLSGSLPHDLRYGGLSISSNPETQVDNKIPQIVSHIGHSIPKLARLALECQSPNLRSPCQPGQKWHCLPDGDRWRKHKCKLQKKCTCFTPTGFVYTRLFSEDRAGAFEKSRFGSRKKRSSDIWTHVPDSIDYSTLLSLMARSSRVMSRSKRESTDDHITDVVDDLEQELVEAEEIEGSMNATFTLGQEPNMTKCSVTSQGKVNCSSLIYSDFRIWKKNRDEIEARIKALKSELDALKEIRKHLREKRPKSVTATAEVFNLTTSPTASTITDEINMSETNIETEATEITSQTQQWDRGTDLDVTGLKYFTEEPVGSGTSTKETPITYSSETAELSTTKPPDIDVSYREKSHFKVRKNEDGFANRIHGVTMVNRGRDRCICRPDNQDMMSKKEEKELAKEARKKLKEEKLRKKERRLKKKAKLEKECLSEKMNCFIHDNEHWRTPPLWTEGPFCFCMNANNNTYSCLRTINATHNFLYCEFTTGFKTFYNLRIDPFEQLNRISTLTPDELRFLSNQLEDMKVCKGTKECTMGSGRDSLGFHHQNHPLYPPRYRSELPY